MARDEYSRASLDIIRRCVDMATDQVLGGILCQATYTPKQVANILQVTPLTLARWRKNGEGPAFVQHPGGGTVIYTNEAVLDFLALNSGAYPKFSRSAVATTIASMMPQIEEVYLQMLQDKLPK